MQPCQSRTRALFKRRSTFFKQTLVLCKLLQEPGFGALELLFQTLALFFVAGKLRIEVFVPVVLITLRKGTALRQEQRTCGKRGAKNETLCHGSRR